jgi:hypothetical protein
MASNRFVFGIPLDQADALDRKTGGRVYFLQDAGRHLRNPFRVGVACATLRSEVGPALHIQRASSIEQPPVPGSDN